MHYYGMIELCMFEMVTMVMMACLPADFSVEDVLPVSSQSSTIAATAPDLQCLSRSSKHDSRTELPVSKQRTVTMQCSMSLYGTIISL